jgi:hypothetical protein
MAAGFRATRPSTTPSRRSTATSSLSHWASAVGGRAYGAPPPATPSIQHANINRSIDWDYPTRLFIASSSSSRLPLLPGACASTMCWERLVADRCRVCVCCWGGCGGQGVGAAARHKADVLRAARGAHGRLHAPLRLLHLRGRCVLRGGRAQIRTEAVTEIPLPFYSFQPRLILIMRTARLH